MSNEVYNVETNRKILEIKEGKNVYKINIRIRFKKLDSYLKAVRKGTSYQNAFDELIESDEINIKSLSIESKILIIDKIIEEYGLDKYKEQIDTKDDFEKLYKMFALYEEENIKEVSKAFKSLAEATKKIVQTISDLNVSGRIENALKQFETFSKDITKKFKDLDIQLNEKIENHRKWAEYGWTIIPEAPINFFDEDPKSQKDADDKCLEIIMDEEIQKLLDYLLKNINQKEKLEEAILCYNEEFYLATAMILTSLIERNLIELPMPDPTARKPRKKSIMMKRFQEPLKAEETGIVEYFYLNNVFKYLEKLFEDGDDFIEQRYNVNRNFLMHGWRDLETTKVDCIKLILALYNILFLWEHK